MKKCEAGVKFSGRAASHAQAGCIRFICWSGPKTKLVLSLVIFVACFLRKAGAVQSHSCNQLLDFA